MRNEPRASRWHRYPPRRGPDTCARCGADRTALTPAQVAAYSDFCETCWERVEQHERIASANRVVVSSYTSNETPAPGSDEDIQESGSYE